MAIIGSYFAGLILGSTPVLAAAAIVPDGYVVSVDSATVYLDWGKASGAQSGDRFALYRPGEPLKHPVSGEILGQAEVTLGAGALERIEDKFSIGQLSELRESVKPGDRSRWQGPAPASVAPLTLTRHTAGERLSRVAPSPSRGEGGGEGGPVERGIPVLKELWHSDPIKEEAVGIAVGDALGDGQQDIIVAFRRSIQVFQWKGNHLDAVASFQEGSFRRWLAVDAGDLKAEGRDEIFATAWLEGLNRPRVYVLRWADGKLKVVADFEGFVRALKRADGHSHLLWQNLSRSRELGFTAPCELAWVKNAYRPGTPLNLQLNDDQLFGFAWGAWEKDRGEDFALLQNGQELRVRFTDAKWSSRESYGGTKNDLYIDDRQAGSFLPRLASWRPRQTSGEARQEAANQGDRDQLIVPRNFPTLGINLTRLKLFNKAEISGLTWNDLIMLPAWQIALPAYIADFAIGDGMHASTPQLWIAGVGASDTTVLIAYQLP